MTNHRSRPIGVLKGKVREAHRDYWAKKRAWEEDKESREARQLMDAAYEQWQELEGELARHPVRRRSEAITKAQRERAPKYGPAFKGPGINEYGSDWVAWATKHKD